MPSAEPGATSRPSLKEESSSVSGSWLGLGGWALALALEALAAFESEFYFRPTPCVPLMPGCLERCECLFSGEFDKHKILD